MIRERPLPESPAVGWTRLDDQNGIFFGEAPLQRGLLPVIGLNQDLFYDRPASPASSERTSANWYRKQVQEYMLRYFMRTSTTRTFRSQIEGRPGDPDERLDPDSYQGWGYYQLYYKLADTGEIFEFPPEERFRIIDLREIGPVYEWVGFKIRFFDFVFSRPLVNAGGPAIETPVSLTNYVVLDSNFVVNRKNPEPGVIGEYGFGTPVVPVPDPNSILAYGPSAFSTAFQFITFRVLTSGEIRACLSLVANQPTSLLKVRPLHFSLDLADRLTFGLASPWIHRLSESLDRAGLPPFPLLFTFADLANSLSGGLASYQLCISRTQLYREVMAAHYEVLEDFILQTLPVWNSVSDWLDPSTLPDWIQQGSQPR